MCALLQKCWRRQNEKPGFEGVMILYRPAWLFLFLILIVSSGVQGQPLKIVMNLPAFTLYVYEGEERIRSYPIAIGSPETPTPLGETTIVNREIYPTYYPRHYQEKGLEPVPPGPDNPLGTRWLGLGWEHYGIHGTIDDSSVGRAVSNGCIRMHNEDVEELYALISPGTQVLSVYEVVELQGEHDGRIGIRFFPHVYPRDCDHLEEARMLLKEHDLMDDVHLQSLMVLAQEQEGQLLSLPREISLHVEGQRWKGFRLDYSVYVPGRAFDQGELADMPIFMEIDGEPYVALGEVVDKLPYTAVMVSAHEFYLYRSQDE